MHSSNLLTVFTLRGQLALYPMDEGTRGAKGTFKRDHKMSTWNCQNLIHTT